MSKYIKLEVTLYLQNEEKKHALEEGEKDLKKVISLDTPISIKIDSVLAVLPLVKEGKVSEENSVIITPFDRYHVRENYNKLMERVLDASA